MKDRAVIQVVSPWTPVSKPKIRNVKIDKFLVEYDASKFRAYQHHNSCWKCDLWVPQNLAFPKSKLFCLFCRSDHCDDTVIIHAESDPWTLPWGGHGPRISHPEQINHQTHKLIQNRTPVPCWEHLSQFSKKTIEDFFQSIKQLDSDIAEVCTNVMDFSSSVPSIFDHKNQKSQWIPCWLPWTKW